jgi:hypothetical protein
MIGMNGILNTKTRFYYQQNEGQTLDDAIRERELQKKYFVELEILKIARQIASLLAYLE